MFSDTRPSLRRQREQEKSAYLQRNKMSLLATSYNKCTPKLEKENWNNKKMFQSNLLNVK